MKGATNRKCLPTERGESELCGSVASFPEGSTGLYFGTAHKPKLRGHLLSILPLAEAGL